MSEPGSYSPPVLGGVAEGRGGSATGFLSRHVVTEWRKTKLSDIHYIRIRDSTTHISMSIKSRYLDLIDLFHQPVGFGQGDDYLLVVVDVIVRELTALTVF